MSSLCGRQIHTHVHVNASSVHGLASASVMVNSMEQGPELSVSDRNIVGLLGLRGLLCLRCKQERHTQNQKRGTAREVT